MTRSNVPRGLITCTVLLAFTMFATGARAQSLPVRVAQKNDGALFVVQGTNGWPLVPEQISDDVFANLVTVGDEVDGTLPGPLEMPPISGSVSVTSDGSLYYIQGSMGYPLVPDPIADADLAGLTLGREIDGAVPRALWTSTAGAAPTPTIGPAAPSEAAPAIGGRTTRLCQPAGAASELRWECGDATGYIFNFQANTVSLYTVPNPSRIVDGPIHIVSMGAVSGSWVESSGRQCAYQLVDPYFQNKQIKVTCGP